jgi:hypothetical protein
MSQLNPSKTREQDLHQGHAGSGFNCKVDSFQNFDFLPAGISEVNVLESDFAIAIRAQWCSHSEWNSRWSIE